MNVLGERLSFGIDLKGLELAKMRIRGLGRGFISRLVQNGYDSPKALSDVSIQDLQKIVPEDLARRIAQRVGQPASEVLSRSQKNSPSIQEKIQQAVNKAILLVDRNHPGTVEYRGKTVRLTSKQFRLLATLAESPGKCTPYNAIYEKVWGRDVVVEMQQISYHKAQLLKKIRKVAPKTEAQALITPVSGEGMVLNLRPEEIASGARKAAD
jgi:DNA-binding winged helix-turn-helix (wHTH) protein